MIMKNSVLFAIVLALVSACDNAPQVAQAPARAAEDPAVIAFRNKVQALNDPDEVLASLSGKDRSSPEFAIATDRLRTLVEPRIKTAKTIEELDTLKRYTPTGSILVVIHAQRGAELRKK
jgi:hypothetical protein